MIIKTSELSEEHPLFLSGELPAENYDLLPEASWSPIGYRLEFLKLGKECLIRGTLTATATAPCDRCLDPLPIPLQCDFIHSIEINGERAIDLTPSIHEDILLNLPMVFRCQLDKDNRCPINGRIMQEGADSLEEIRRQETWQALENLDTKD